LVWNPIAALAAQRKKLRKKRTVLLLSSFQSEWIRYFLRIGQPRSGDAPRQHILHN
jgi:hypothetical protein